MKKAGDILKEMGFRADAPASTQEAFFRYLTKAAPLPGSPVESEQTKTQRKIPEQLAFDFAAALPQKKIS